MQLHGCGNAGTMWLASQGTVGTLGVAVQADRARRASGSYGDLLYIATPETIVAVILSPMESGRNDFGHLLRWWRLF